MTRITRASSHDARAHDPFVGKTWWQLSIFLILAVTSTAIDWGFGGSPPTGAPFPICVSVSRDPRVEICRIVLDR